jgi:hypothetical protein
MLFSSGLLSLTLSALAVVEVPCQEAIECDMQGNRAAHAGDLGGAIAAYERSLSVGAEVPAAQRRRIHLKIARAREQNFERTKVASDLLAAAAQRSSAIKLTDPDELERSRTELARTVARAGRALAAPGTMRAEWDRGWRELLRLPVALGTSPAELAESASDQLGRAALALARAEMTVEMTPARQEWLADSVTQVYRWVRFGAVHDDLGRLLGDLRASETSANENMARGLSSAEIAGAVLGAGGLGLMGVGIALQFVSPSSVAWTTEQSAPSAFVAPTLIASGAALGVAGLATGLVGRAKRKRHIDVSAGVHGQGAVVLIRGHF